MSISAPVDTLDYRTLFERAPSCQLVLDREFRIVTASDAYLAATNTKRDQILGRNIFDVFPDNPDDPSATGVRKLRASLERVLELGVSDAMGVQKYDIRRAEEHGGGFEERFWTPTNTPLKDHEGTIQYIVHTVEDVTELVRLEKSDREKVRAIHAFALRTEERSAKLLDGAPDAMLVVGPDGTILFVNLRTERLFGYKRSELLGRPLEVLIPERFRSSHAGHLTQYFANHSLRPMGSGLSLSGRKKHGEEFPIEVSLSPIHDDSHTAVLAAIRDITDRQKLEAAAKLLSNRLSSAVESIQDAFALFDDQDRLVLCNSVYRRLLEDSLPGQLVGLNYETLLNAWVKDISFGSDLERETFKAERLKTRRSDATSSFEVRMNDGRSLRVVDRRTAEGGIVKTIWDLTEDVRLAEELRHARLEAEAASRAKSEFLSSMSHELRTPLNAILGFAQLLQRDKKEPLSDRHKERVHQILRGGEHLLRLIDDILDLSRIEAGGVSISTEAVGVAEVLDEVTSTLEPMASRYGVSVQVAPLPHDSAMVAVDRTRFSQILMNLGSNAIKYNRPEGSVTFIVSQPSLEHTRVTVRDTGLGIPEDKLDKLFQPFQRMGQEAGPIEGTGIGLVITQRLARMMRGDVGFKSLGGQGSEFWVDVPVHESSPRSIRPLPRLESSVGRVAGPTQRRVLYVEDNPANITFMRDLISTFDDLELLTAPTAEVGIELARSRQPEVVMMDINLPGMSGLDALRLLRAHPETYRIPVIALTAAASERDRQRGVAAGFYRYLTKPVQVDELISSIDELLSRPSQP
ncbi:MAG: PAS domain S-box protein [Polyangiaceae bacterium]